MDRISSRMFRWLFCVGVAALLGPTPASATPMTYEECLEQASIDPERAREAAAVWELEGGGSRARHCAAMALIALGAERRAAMLLTEIGSAGSDLDIEDRAVAMQLAAEIWLRADQPKLARQSYHTAALLAPLDVQGHIGLARASAALEDWTGTIAALNDALEIDALQIEALTLRAATYRLQGQPEKALEDARMATDINPESPLSWFERGAAERASGENDAARRSWLNASLLDPEGDVGEMARTNLQRLELGE